LRVSKIISKFAIAKFEMLNCGFANAMSFLDRFSAYFWASAKWWFCNTRFCGKLHLKLVSGFSLCIFAWWLLSAQMTRKFSSSKIAYFEQSLQRLKISVLSDFDNTRAAHVLSFID